MCAPHPIPANATYYTPRAALAVLADEMHDKCEELFGGARLGQWSAALLIDSYADRIERALGIQPLPKSDVDAVTANPPMDAVREPYALPALPTAALPDTIAEARRALDREARGDIAFHAVLLAAVIAIIATAILA